MRTWLDEYVRFAADGWRAFTDLTLRAGIGLVNSTETEYEAAYWFTKCAFTTPELLANMASSGENPSDVYERDELIMYKLFHSWVAGQNGLYVLLENLANKALMFLMGGMVPGEDPLALQLTPELAADFRGAAAPTTNDWMATLEKHGVVYVDFPPGTYSMGEVDGSSIFTGRGNPMVTLDVRGVFVSLDLMQERDIRTFWMNKGEPLLDPDTWPKMNVLVVCQEAGRRLAIDTCFYYGFADGEPWSMYGRLAQWNCHLLSDAGGDPLTAFPPMMDEAIDLVKLCLLYHQSGEGDRPALPHLEYKRLEKMQPKKAKAALKTHSLFKITQLQSPKGRFGREGDVERKPGTGYKLGARVKVRGHFRWQPHGPAKSLRRLQWIAGFERGPKDAPTRPALHVLRKSK